MFFTRVIIPRSALNIDYSGKYLFVGSCFSENIGNKFKNSKFNVVINPSGIIYNPLSIKSLFDSLLKNKIYTPADLFFDGDKYRCFDFHGRFADRDAAKLVETINQSLLDARNFLSDTDIIFITPGTAYVWFLKQSGRVVSNCHKADESIFLRSMLNVNEIYDAFASIIIGVKSINSKVKFVFSVSPLRHIKDGLHGSQLSKSSLLLAIDSVVNNFDNAEYFPSYEIVNDELRDYRFYQQDMIHITPQAENYIYNKFKQAYFTFEMRSFSHKVEKFMLAANHQIIDINSLKTRDFISKTINKAVNLQKEIKGLDLSAEIANFNCLLND